MINLIPPVAKRNVKREYWLRVLVVWLFLFDFCILVAALLTTPSFVLVQGQLAAFEQQMQSAAAEASEQQALSDTIRHANEQAGTVLAVSSVDAITPYLERIEAIRTPAIQLTNLAVQRTETAVSSITVSGVAQTRQSLTGFSNALVADELFTAADVPLANLAANENLGFTIDIIVATPE